MSNDSVCKVTDDHVPTLRWVVQLDNGETIYQDDGRPGMDPPSAWIRLGNYVRNNGFKIVGLLFQFRSHNVHIEPNAEGYYFAKGAIGYAGAPETFQQFVAGFLKEGIIYKTWFQVPELIVSQTGEQLAETAGLSLIRNDYAEKTNESVKIPVEV
jgi:hypothetical protein